MTGYLHLRDDEELPLQIVEAIWPAAAGRAERHHLVVAENVLAVLRGLSVEPTEDPRIAELRSLASYLQGLAPGDQHYAGLIRKALSVGSTARPVPVQEDQ